jgi:hypothetical protein
MAFRYQIQQNNIDDNHYEANPSWLIMFIRYAYPASYDRTKPVDGKFYSRSIAPLIKNPVVELPPLIVENDCVNWNTTTSKGAHVSGANAVFANSGVDYSKAVTTGDWMIIWAFNNNADAHRVAQNLRSNGAAQQANKFNDGLKFIGRVSGISRRASIEPDSGQRTVFFSIDAQGFTDLDAQIYYNEAISINYQDSNAFLVNVLGITIDQFNDAGGFVTTQDVVPVLIKVLLGLGTKDTAQKSLNVGTPDGPITVSPNQAYRIPKTLANILFGSDFPPPNNTVGYTYSDILKIVIGVQKYNTTYSPSATSSAQNSPATGFFNNSWAETSNNVYNTGIQLTAKYTFPSINFNNTTVWGILERFINTPVDEMYTCLRVFPSQDPNNQDGEIFPTLVCRQVPLNTDPFVNNSPLQATAFSEIPRWVLDSTMVSEENLVKSESQRKNYVHIYGQDLLGQNSSENIYAIMSAIPPIFDSSDIQRHGLRAIIRQLPVDTQFLNSTGTSATDHPGAYWSSLVADQLIDSHNKFSGSLNSKLIQEPICEGDNLEYNDLLFHIERVIHTGSVNLESGKRTANTILHVTNGLAVVQPDLTTVDYGTLTVYSSNSDPEIDNIIDPTNAPQDSKDFSDS